MKLLYSPEGENAACFERESMGEALMYCVPYNFTLGMYKTGYIAVTPTRILRISEGEAVQTFLIGRCTRFFVEQMFGSCGFYVECDGKVHLVCRFIAGKHLARYQVICRALELLKDKPDGPAIENSTPEKYCPKCGRPFVAHSTICPFCMNKADVYKKLWALTKGLRLIIFSPFIFSLITIILNFPISWFVQWLSGMSGINAVLPWWGAIGLVAISMILTLIAGLFPATLASKKDPVEALRTE